jgi:hypothetical protein
MIKFVVITLTILSCVNIFVRLASGWRGFFGLVTFTLGLILFFFGGIYSFLEQAHRYLPVCGVIMLVTGVISCSLAGGSSDD